MKIGKKTAMTTLKSICRTLIEAFRQFISGEMNPLIYLLLYCAVVFVYSLFYYEEIGSISNRLESVYFSAITMSTIGYGDIVPRSEIAKEIAISQTVVGFIIPGLFIASLTRLYSRKQQSLTQVMLENFACDFASSFRFRQEYGINKTSKRILEELNYLSALANNEQHLKLIDDAAINVFITRCSHRKQTLVALANSAAQLSPRHLEAWLELTSFICGIAELYPNAKQYSLQLANSTHSTEIKSWVIKLSNHLTALHNSKKV